jgi:hypothetical protein
MRDLNELLQTVFDGVVDRLQQRQIEVPDRQYISAGSAVAYDMEQLTVNLNRVTGGRPGGEDVVQYNPFRVYMAEVQVTLLRKAPMIGTRGLLPSVEAEEASALIQVADMAALTEILGEMAQDGSLYQNPALRGIPVAVGATMPYGPQGGIVGSVVVVSVQVV